MMEAPPKVERKTARRIKVSMEMYNRLKLEAERQNKFMSDITDAALSSYLDAQELENGELLCE